MKSSLQPNTPFVYILLLRSGKYDVGSSTDYLTRFKKHQYRNASHITKIDPPHAVLWIELSPTFSSARLREIQLKKWSHAKKAALIESNFARLRVLSQSRSGSSKVTAAANGAERNSTALPAINLIQLLKRD